jgi:AmmeMemoRadiSam system protein B
LGESVRLPCQAGSFYAASERSLRQQIEECFIHDFGSRALPNVREQGLRRVIALVSPHAGYMYSGSVAAKGYAYVANDGRPDSIVIVGPNHTGYGTGISIMLGGVWRTPLGDLRIDAELATDIQKHSEFIDVDSGAHLYEHSIEVQLPFLQYVYGSVQFVPICMRMQDVEVSRDVGAAIARASVGKNVLIIASTDLSHYEPQSIAEKKDRLALDAISSLDEEALQAVVEARSISMCGYGPVSAAIVASKTLGAEKTVLLQHKTSGDITGDKRQVVGYASAVMVK